MSSDDKGPKKSTAPSDSPRVLYCSFCGNSEHDVKMLIAGPSVFICDACTDLSVRILTEGDNYSFLPNVETIAKKAGKPTIDFDALGFKPRFKKLTFATKKSHCFYLGPFHDPFNTIYAEHIKPLVNTAGFTIDRADEIFGTQPIIEDIWESINSAEIILADVSGKNPNVMYEIGMAHTVGRPVVIMTQDINDVPFDLKHYRCIIYSYTPKDMKQFEEQVKGTFAFVRGTK